MSQRFADTESLWKKTKKEDFKGISKHNQKILNDFLNDFEIGVNTPKGSKGIRKAGTLLKLRGAVGFLLKNHSKTNAEALTKKEFHDFFKNMYDGKITKNNGKSFKDVGDYVKNVKTFWKWMIKTKKVDEDITDDLSRADYKRGKPSWVFLGNENMKKLIDQARGDYRALILFLYDSGIRPQEAYRIKVYDFSENFSVLNIPEKRENGDKVSKTFERTIKLKQCSGLIKNYVETNKLKSDDFFIIPTQPAFNKYLKSLSKTLFGEDKTKARGCYNEITLYDIRHNSACFWLDKYRTHKDLMYRMGWKKEEMIIYYSEFLGRRDNIDDDDMITSEDKTKLEGQVDNLKKMMQIVFDHLNPGDEKTIRTPERKIISGNALKQKLSEHIQNL